MDGKGLGYGFRGDSFGDVNCWGFEGEPTLAEKQDAFKREVHFIQSLSLNVSDNNSIKQCRHNCNHVLRMVSQHVKELHQIIDTQNKAIAKYTHLSQANPHYKDKFTMCIGGATYTENNCKAVINRALNLNKEICLAAAALNSNAQSTSKTGVVNLNYQPNYFALFWPEQIPDVVQFMENDKFIKPGSQLWLDL